MAPGLKVFEWLDGFRCFTVAASSRPKALEAWGVKQDIFASGLAREAPEAEDGAAARASPGQVIERGLSLGIDRAGPRPSRAARTGPTPAKNGQAEALLVRIEALERSMAEEVRLVEQDIRALEARRDDLQRRFSEARNRLAGELDAARSGP
ncbi:hypothetical protein ABE444_03765 [Brevundimonas pondensis]|uniref:hypothetical protein n=1 Tax=Brevundimonas pondensis TaxID=2774189 RepID=UPI00320A0FD9